MPHHKRKRPKSQRAGCLYCKPHKRNHAKTVDLITARTGRDEAEGRLREVEGRLDAAIVDEPGPRCLHCNGVVCTFVGCPDHPESTKITDGWCCSTVCLHAVTAVPGS